MQTEQHYHYKYVRTLKSRSVITEFIKSAIEKYHKSRLKNSDFTIISNDCWGAEIYREHGLEYKTPFVGLMVMAPCYIQILSDLPTYLTSDIHFRQRSKYDNVNDFREKSGNYFPIGVLKDDVEIHFFHYRNPQEAKEKWERRKQRVNWEKIFVKFDCSKDLCSEEILHKFDEMKLKKVCFGSYRNKRIQSLVFVPDWVFDGHAMYRISSKYFDIVNWLNGGNGRLSPVNKALALLLFKLKENSYIRIKIRNISSETTSNNPTKSRVINKLSS